MSAPSYTRQTLILDPAIAEATHVTICGLGTIGSNSAVELAKMGVGSFHLIDADVVEDHNLPSQAFHLDDIGKPKAQALAERIADVSNAQVRAEQTMLNGGEVFDAGPVVLAVDSMEARKSILELSVADRPSHPLLIDGRMAGKMWQLLALDPSDSEQVAKWVTEHYFETDKASPIPCGGRSVSFIGGYIGSIVASYICRSLNEESVPFFAMGDLDTYRVSIL